MSHWFDFDSLIMRFLGRVMDLVLLNLCFIIGCIPIVTIGTSMTAMYSVSLKLVRNEEDYIFQSFWKNWKENFKQSTLVWLLILTLGFLFWIEYHLIHSMPQGAFPYFLVFWSIMLVIFFLVVWNIFPYMARYDDKVRICILNSFKLAIRHVFYSIIALTAFSLLVILSLWNMVTVIWMLCFWLLIGFSFVMYVNSLYMRRIFDRIEADREI